MSFLNRFSETSKAFNITTTLSKNTFQQGEEITGKVEVTNIGHRKAIKHLILYLTTPNFYMVDIGKPPYHEVIRANLIFESTFLDVGETKIFPISLKVPFNSPITHTSTILSLETELTHNGGVSKETTYLNITPSSVINSTILALESLLGSATSQCLLTTPQTKRTLPFIQELTFKPQKITYKEALKSVKVSFFAYNETRVDVLLWIQAHDSDYPQHHRFNLVINDTPSLRERLTNLFSPYIAKH